MKTEDILIDIILELEGESGTICDMMHEQYNQADWCEKNCGKHGEFVCKECVKRLADAKKKFIKDCSKQSIIERIDEIRANSVTDEEFKKVWGKSIDESVNELMEKCNELEEKSKVK